MSEMAAHSFHEDSEQCYCGATTRMGEFYVAAVARWKEEPDAIEQLVANNIRIHSEKAAAQAALARAEQALADGATALNADCMAFCDSHTSAAPCSCWPERIDRTRRLLLAAATTTQPPAADALAERVRELEAALSEIRDSITGALLPSAGLTHNAAPNSIPIQTYLISADGVKTLGAALAASSQPEAGAAVCRCRHPLSDHGDGGCLFEHGIGAICSCLTFEASDAK